MKEKFVKKEEVYEGKIDKMEKKFQADYQ